MAEFMGMPGSKPKEKSPDQQDEFFTCGLSALRGENLEEAFLCFSCLTNCAASRFNLALCFVLAGLHEKALEELTQAEKRIPPLRAELGQPAVPPEILLQDGRGESYRAPMERRTPFLFPAQARLRVLRLKADLYAKLGYIEELRAILPVFAGKNCENIEKLQAKITD